MQKELRIIVRVREEGESMADKVHCIRKTLRLMPEEAKMLEKKACDNGMNEAEYIRLLISQKPNDCLLYTSPSPRDTR